MQWNTIYIKISYHLHHVDRSRSSKSGVPAVQHPYFLPIMATKRNHVHHLFQNNQFPSFNILVHRYGLGRDQFLHYQQLKFVIKSKIDITTAMSFSTNIQKVSFSNSASAFSISFLVYVGFAQWYFPQSSYPLSWFMCPSSSVVWFSHRLWCEKYVKAQEFDLQSHLSGGFTHLEKKVWHWHLVLICGIAFHVSTSEDSGITFRFLII